jgi:poly [ADP-ribose] polymerase
MKAYLIFVEHNGINSNKYYNMELNGSAINVEYGRVGVTKQTATYPAGKWDSLLKSKIKKGYTDITHLKNKVEIIVEESHNKEFNNFYNIFSKYTGNFIRNNYSVEGCTKAQIEEAQSIINQLSLINVEGVFNFKLVELFKIIPRKMSNVKDYLLTDLKNKNQIINREQSSLDSMDSMNIITSSNPYKDLDIDFKEINTPKEISDLINNSNNTKYRIHKCFKITDKTNINSFNSWLDSQKNKHTEYLIHGTRNQNIFNILKSGLLIRPSNAAVISGAAYGEGIYHSSHAAKSIGYTGGDSDKIFFIQNVHMA